MKFLRLSILCTLFAALAMLPAHLPTFAQESKPASQPAPKPKADTEKEKKKKELERKKTHLVEEVKKCTKEYEGTPASQPVARQKVMDKVKQCKCDLKGVMKELKDLEPPPPTPPSGGSGGGGGGAESGSPQTCEQENNIPAGTKCDC